uniref:Uncharacterized protein n=1 Tax=Acrobeloides nanus TaxID=290746 RepID=A0A914CF84_9BILA
MKKQQHKFLLKSHIILLIIFSLAYIPLCYGNEHDSLLCEETGTCADSIHTVIKLAKRDDALARRIARDYGLEVKGKPFLESHYFLAHPAEHTSRRKRSVLQSLSEHPDVQLVNEVEPRPRRQATSIYNSGREIPRLPFQDPLYRDQWYLVGGAIGGYDMNVREAWLLGYAGRNVSISILDDGIQRDHLDIAANYDPLASTDINDHDDDPTPQNNGDNKHGTRCAGEVSAIAGNNVCGVGVAFHSKIGGVRMLDGPVSDSVEAASLNLNQHHIDIYSASWGPEDDGKTFDGPGPLAREAFYRGIKEGRGGKGNIFVWASGNGEAFYRGIKEGRGGKGNIFVWASGNGGSRQDSCSADGYTTSIYTLSISSATFDNRRPWYLEECPSTIASTYSSANINQPAIVTVWYYY